MLSCALLLFITSLVPSEIAFRIIDPELIPEGIASDAQTKKFFVGSTFKRKIVAIVGLVSCMQIGTRSIDSTYAIDAPVTQNQ